LKKTTHLIPIGQQQELTILRHTTVGLYLGDEAKEEDVLLPNKYCSEDFKIGGKLTVFVYRDSDERKIATNLQPKIRMHEFALLRVTSVSNIGAFVDWGLEKELLVPFREQRQRMEVGRWYIVYLDCDTKTDRLFATNKLEKKLQNNTLTVREGEAVEVIIMRKTDLGFSVIVNQQHEGLIFESEIFTALNIGEKIKAYVKQIRDDNKIDIALHPVGFENSNDPNSKKIMDQLKDNKGVLPLADKSTPEEIYEALGMSKKAFKKAIGTLYKQRRITLHPDSIQLV
jgi:uncharacterized protein